MQPILLVPLDERPCCLQFVRRLAAMGGVELLTPPQELLGCFLEPGQPERLIEWYRDICHRAEKAIVSLDMLAFGGLVASRRSEPDLATARGRLQEWVDIVAPGTWAFQSILRTAPTQTNPEEMRQAQVLLELSRLGASLAPISRANPGVSPRGRSLDEVVALLPPQGTASWVPGLSGGPVSHQDIAELLSREEELSSDQVEDILEKFAQEGIEVVEEEDENIVELKASLPPGVLAAYLATRERNHRLNALALDLVWKGKLDGLLLGIDDSKTRGWNVNEVRDLQSMYPNLPSAFIAPGTDEAAQLLLARLCNPGRKIQVRWSHPQLAHQITRYEDRSLGELVAAQLAAAGLVEAPESRWQLWIFGRPEKAQGEAEEQGHPSVPRRFLGALEATLALGARIVVADVAHANGGDLGLGRGLASLLDELLGYSAWNTAGNTLGTALACLGCASDDPSSLERAMERRFARERWLDDLVYQSVVRPQLKAELGTPGLNLAGELLLNCQSGLGERLARASESLGLVVPPSFSARLPWSRLFEVEVAVGGG